MLTDEEIQIGEQVAIATVRSQPTVTALRDHMLKFGPEGVLESAAHLPEPQQKSLRNLARRMRWNRHTRRWEKS